jgi:hypothetical protein
LSNAGSCEADGVFWTWKNDVNLCRKLGKSLGYVSNHRKKSLSYSEIIRKCITDGGSDSGNPTKDMSLFKKDDDGND